MIKMLRSIVVLLILSDYTCISQPNTIDLKNNYQPDTVFTGTWVIDRPRSYSREDGLFFDSFAFDEDASVLEKLNSRIANYNIFMLQQLGLDTISNLKIVSAGVSKTGLYSFKKEEEVRFDDTYLFINIDGFYRMILFFGEHDFKDEMGDAMVFHVTDFSRLNHNELVLANLDLRSEFYYKRINTGENTTPSFRNPAKNDLNPYGFRGKVKTVTTKVYTVKKLDGGAFLPSAIRSIAIMEFDDQGNKVSEKWLKFGIGNYSPKWHIIKYQGDLGSTTITSNGVDPNYPDRIHISRKDSLETVITYKKGVVDIHTESKLVNGQKVLTTYLSDGQIKTIKYDYAPNGDLDYIIGTGDQNETVFEQAYYYLDFDDHGNWTRRINYADRRMREHQQLVIRHMVYY